MTKENVERFLAEIAQEYAGAAQVKEGAQHFVRIPLVHFPEGCTPPTTAALVVLEEQQPIPQMFVKDLPKLPSGKSPRSISSATLAGESWQGFSFNQRWDENFHTA